MFFIQTEGRDRIGSRGRSAPIAQALAHGVYGGGRAHGGGPIVWPVDRAMPAAQEPTPAGVGIHRWCRYIIEV